MTLTVFRSMLNFSAVCPINGIYLMFFSWRDWDYRFGEEEQRSVIYIISYQDYILINMIFRVDFELNHMAVEVLVRFLHWKAPAPHLPYTSILSSLEGSHYVQPTLMGWDLWPSPRWRISMNYLKLFCRWNLSLLIYAFVCLFIYTVTCLYWYRLTLHAL